MKKQFDNWLALKITNAVSSMNMAYAFSLLALTSLPAILVQGGILPASTFPKWLISASLIALVAWVAQTFLQLVLLSVIMVGQKVQSDSTLDHVKKHLDDHHDRVNKLLDDHHNKIKQLIKESKQ